MLKDISTFTLKHCSLEPKRVTTDSVGTRTWHFNSNLRSVFLFLSLSTWVLHKTCHTGYNCYEDKILMYIISVEGVLNIYKNKTKQNKQKGCRHSKWSSVILCSLLCLRRYYRFHSCNYGPICPVFNCGEFLIFWKPPAWLFQKRMYSLKFLSKQMGTFLSAVLAPMLCLQSEKMVLLLFWPVLALFGGAFKADIS